MITLIIINFMLINVFCCRNDFSIRSNEMFLDNRLCAKDILLLHDGMDDSLSVVLLTAHSTNFRLIQYIRKTNVITPIYVVSDNNHNDYKQKFTLNNCTLINGIVYKNYLNYNHLLNKLSNYPQRYIWNYVFNKDKLNSELILNAG